VALASGEKIALNFNGDSLFNVSIDKGTLKALVENKQAIVADGGKVILTAKAADDLLSAQVNNSGIIQAQTMAALTGGGFTRGRIELRAKGGTTTVSGTLDVSAPKGGDGGYAAASGDAVKTDGAVIATGAASGAPGVWLINPLSPTGAE